MKEWLIHLLGGYTKRDYAEYAKYTSSLLNATIELHNMQAAWAQVKQQHKIRRVH